MLLGLVLLILEVQTFGNFYLMFFGLGGLLVGLLVAIGVAEADWLQWLLFSVLSVVTLVLFRQPIVKRLSSAGPKVDSLVGEVAVVSAEIPAGGVGKAELRGSMWSARNGGPAPLKKNERCRVERVEGLTLWIRPE